MNMKLDRIKYDFCHLEKILISEKATSKFTSTAETSASTCAQKKVCFNTELCGHKKPSSR